MVKIKHSVSTRIANYLIVIIIFVGVIASLSFALMAGIIVVADDTYWTGNVMRTVSPMANWSST